MKLNYVDISFSPNKLKFDASNILTKLLIIEQNVFHVEIFALLKYGRKLH